MTSIARELEGATPAPAAVTDTVVRALAARLSLTPVPHATLAVR